MADEFPQAAQAEPTDVRFGTRALLLVMVGVALAAAALGPYFRSLEPNERAWIAPLWGASGLVVLGLVGYHGQKRYRLERQAGPTIIALTVRGRRIRNAKPWVTILGGCLWVAWGLYYLVISSEELDRARSAWSQSSSILSRGAFGAIFIALGIVTIWWNQRIQLREHGVMRGLRLLRWSHVTGSSWSAGALSLEGVDQRHHDIRMSMNVPAAERDKVETILAQKHQRRDQPQGGESPSTEMGALSQPIIPIKPNDEVSLRRVVTMVGIYIAIVVMIAFRPWGRPPAEFYVAATAGFFCTVLAILHRRNRLQMAGPPLVRLKLRIDWLRVAGMIAIMSGCYYAIQHVSFANSVLAGVLGFVSGVAASVILGMMMRDKFDLCGNGVVISQWDFWPRDGIRVSRWNRDGNGRLVLNYGWRRIMAKVPPDRRAAVDAVIADTTERRD